MTKEIIEDIKKAVLYQHKALTEAVKTCNADQFILIQNRINVRTILVHLKRLEDLFVFKKHRAHVIEDIQILKDILVRPEL